jgi:hypothetical protein
MIEAAGDSISLKTLDRSSVLRDSAIEEIPKAMRAMTATNPKSDCTLVIVALVPERARSA